MLQPKLSSPESNHNGNNPLPQDHPNGQPGVDIQQELNRLEDMVLSSLRIPLTGRTLIDEEKLLEQLDFVRLSLPSVFQEAAELLQHKEEIMLEAEEYGQQVVEAAQAKRAQILAESDIIRQAEREAEQLRRKVQQECDAMMQDTEAEIERKRRACMQELEEMRQSAIAQAQEIEDGADQYADNVLENIEQDLQEMLRIITNGRLQLRGDIPKQRNSPNPKKR
ncbi:DivIVA domain-containing protein [Anabaena lutea]|uniref:DivIVA domain-containing protein n=1 Tax=Anabaena lutea FACHB-196 TaxID=2692881 RepID=A0ABR8FLC8_9NOST|nr:DivIVA domain-containing protein [Anabaena lutea]MBD2570482.1 DivIVA domain-containing protein [Anabaena lutea FACHB-196]